RAAQLPPGRAAVRGFEDLRLGGRSLVVRKAATRPRRGVDSPRVAGRGAHVRNARAVARRENLPPVLTSVRSPVDAARHARNGVAERADEDGVRVMRVNDDREDVARVTQADVSPGRAAVRRPVDSVAFGLLARAYVDDLR